MDRDQAVTEAAAALAEPTRRGLLRRLGVVAGGSAIAGIVPLGLASGGGARLRKDDVKILNFALTLEHMLAAFYAEALAKGKLEGSARTFATTVAAHEAAHVAELQKLLGGQAAKKPKLDFGEATSSRKAFLDTATSLEDCSVAAYQGQAGRISSRTVLATAGSLLSVEARHSAWIRYIIGDGKQVKPAPDAFSAELSMSAVRHAVSSTGFIRS